MDCGHVMILYFRFLKNLCSQEISVPPNHQNLIFTSWSFSDLEEKTSRFRSVAFVGFLDFRFWFWFRGFRTVKMESGDVGEWIPLKCAIYTWGYNKCGQTARKGKEPHLRIPWRLSQNLFRCPDDSQKSRWLDVACGWEHTAAVASDGSLFTWGLISSDFWFYDNRFMHFSDSHFILSSLSNFFLCDARQEKQ